MKEKMTVKIQRSLFLLKCLVLLETFSVYFSKNEFVTDISGHIGTKQAR